MPKDYKHTGQARRKATVESNNGWLWLIVGFVLGFAAAMGVTWLQQSDTELPRVELPEGTDSENGGEENADEEGDGEGSRFNFYRMLERFEVIVPEEEVRVRETEDGSPAPSESGPYVLQVGSFRNEADADRLRANLGLAGFESHIQQVSIDDGTTYHRVRIGPIESVRDMERIRNRLENEGIEPLLIRLREDN